MKRFNVNEPELIVDEDEPKGYGAEYARIGPAIGAEKLAANLVVLKQDERLCPYHYECDEAEWLIVLEGTPTVRTPEGDEVCEPGDVVHFPPGPEGAHQIANYAPETARVIMLSEVRHPAAAVYPDSDKIGIFMPDEPRRTLVPRSKTVDYWVDEPPLNDETPL
jgi:uncharacterized cupin superfamily protein